MKNKVLCGNNRKLYDVNRVVVNPKDVKVIDVEKNKRIEERVEKIIKVADPVITPVVKLYVNGCIVNYIVKGKREYKKYKEEVYDKLVKDMKEAVNKNK